MHGNWFIDNPSPDIFGEVFNSAVPIAPVARHRLRAHGFERTRDRRLDLACFGQVARLDLAENLAHSRGRRRRTCGQYLEQNSTQPVDVSAAIDQRVVGCDLLGSHVGRRADRSHRLLGLGLGGNRDAGLPCCGCVVALAHDLGQAPVEHDDFPVAPEHDVLRLQIAMDDPARVRVSHRLTHLHERFQQLPLQLKAMSGLARAATVKLGDRVAQGLPAEKAHRVKRLIVFLPPGQLIHRHDVGVFELARNLRFLQEPAPRLRIGDRRRFDLLECDVAIEVRIMGDPDLAQPPLGVQPRQGVAQRVALRRRRHERFHQHVPPGRRQRMQRPANFGVLDRLQDFTRFDLGHRPQRRAHVAVVLLELALEFSFHVAAILLGDPLAFDQKLGKRPIQPHRPAGTDVGKLRLVNQVILKRDHGKQQIPIHIYSRCHGTGLLRAEHSSQRKTRASFILTPAARASDDSAGHGGYVRCDEVPRAHLDFSSSTGSKLAGGALRHSTARLKRESPGKS